MGSEMCIRDRGDTEPNWVHHDSVSAERKELAKSQNYKLWAGVIYLTPNAPLDAGTSLWIRDDGIKIAEDSVGKLPKGIPPVGWTKHASASNIYTRLVLYRGDHYHAPDKAGFGNSRETGRLTQLIVFMTE